MRRSQPKSHTISQRDSPWTLALPAFFVLVVLVSIVVLGVLGEADSPHAVHAEENAAAAESQRPPTPDLLVGNKH